MDLKMMKLVTALATAALTSAVSAGTAPFSMVSGVSAPGIDVSLTIQNLSLIHISEPTRPY